MDESKIKEYVATEREKYKHVKFYEINVRDRVWKIHDDTDDAILILFDDNNNDYLVAYHDAAIPLAAIRLTEDTAEFCLESGDIMTIPLAGSFISIEQETKELYSLKCEYYPPYIIDEKTYKFPLYDIKTSYHNNSLVYFLYCYMAPSILSPILLAECPTLESLDREMKCFDILFKTINQTILEGGHLVKVTTIDGEDVISILSVVECRPNGLLVKSAYDDSYLIDYTDLRDLIFDYEDDSPRCLFTTDDVVVMPTDNEILNEIYDIVTLETNCIYPFYNEPETISTYINDGFISKDFLKMHKEKMPRLIELYNLLYRDNIKRLLLVNPNDSRLRYTYINEQSIAAKAEKILELEM